MKKALGVLLAAAAIGAAAITVPAPAQARNEGAAVAAGVAGLAVGAMIGSAAARPAYPAYAPAPGYVVYQSYYAPYPVGCPGGYWARKPVAFDRWGNPVAWSKPRFICP
jgi:hypothetical protein